MASTGKTYIVEHLDDELGAWSELEYMTIAKESHDNGASFFLTSVPPSLELPERLKTLPGFVAKPESVEELYPEKSRVCLLDPSATKELSPEDGDTFDVFLFGGILGMSWSHFGCQMEVESVADYTQVTTRQETGPLSSEKKGSRDAVWALCR